MPRTRKKTDKARLREVLVLVDSLSSLIIDRHANDLPDDLIQEFAGLSREVRLLTAGVFPPIPRMWECKECLFEFPANIVDEDGKRRCPKCELERLRVVISSVKNTVASCLDGKLMNPEEALGYIQTVTS